MSSFIVPDLALDEFVHGWPIPMFHRELTGHPVAWLYVSLDLVNDAIASAIQRNHIFILRILSHSFLQFIWFVDSVSLKMVVGGGQFGGSWWDRVFGDLAVLLSTIGVAPSTQATYSAAWRMWVEWRQVVGQKKCVFRFGGGGRGSGK